MNIVNKTETKNCVKFKDLQFGDVFAAKRRDDICLGELYFRAELEENVDKDLSEGGWAINLKTGMKIFLDEGYMLTPVEAEIVVERILSLNSCKGCKHFNKKDRFGCMWCERYHRDLWEEEE